MNILLFSFNFPPNDGGIARLAAALLEQIDKRQQNVRLLTYEKTVGKLAEKTLLVPKKRGLAELTALFKSINFKGTIISTLWYPEGLLSCFSKAKKKVILVHGSELLPHPVPFKEFFLKPLKKLTLRQADLIVANSQFTANMAQKLSPHTNIIVNTPAVDVKFFFPKNKLKAKSKYGLENKFVLLTVAIVQEHKGYEMVFRAIQQLPADVLENLVYLIAGQGEDEEKFRSMAKKMRIEKYVRWLGFVPDSHLNDLYNASDTFLLCSKNRLKHRYVEGFGMVLLEAQACGIPVIGTDVGGIPDAIHSHPNNHLIEENDVERLVELIKTNYTNKHNLRSKRLNLKSWEQYISTILGAL